MITTGIINNLYSLGKSFGRLSNSFFVRQFFSTKIILSPKININNSQKKSWYLLPKLSGLLSPTKCVPTTWGAILK